MNRVLHAYPILNTIYRGMFRPRLRRSLGCEVHETPRKLTPNDGDSF